MISVATENRRTPTKIGAVVRKIGEVWSVNQPKKSEFMKTSIKLQQS